ncbi:hypothetical protein [Actinomycetospora straminea]|uniref:Uncharacterized protein n=1 Tax=Actinomycetospora straminea TaxID=663607 RepID=A0ABP9EQT9_9PSEU|nr:hypothetical protein [Actinomycetospora straminea]MDD7933510.1 hypothetical protein [Actinomycetospora straminea]
MGRHSAPDGAQDRDVPATPQRIRVVLVPRPRAAPPVEAGDPADAPPTPTLPAWIALDEQQRIRRAWADAPGGFVRTGVRGPRTPPAGAIPVQPVVERPAPPDGGWGPWPPEALRDHHHPALLPAVLPVPAAARRRRPAVTAVTAVVAVLVVLLVGLGVVLARPDLAGPLLPTTPEVASVTEAR